MGLVIGRGGGTVKALQASSGAIVVIISRGFLARIVGGPTGRRVVTERASSRGFQTVVVRGSEASVTSARAEIERIVKSLFPVEAQVTSTPPRSQPGRS